MSDRRSRRPRTGAIVLAAGASRRMGGGDKLLADLAGRPVLAWSLAALHDCESIDEMVVVTSQANRDAVAELCRGLYKIRALAPGGRERQDSVWSGLRAMAQVDLMLVHDGARPLITPEAVTSCIERASEDVSVVAGGAATDTIKVVDPDEQIASTPQRSTLRAVATPQVFSARTLRRAHETARQDGFLGTDDASLVERLGEPVIVHDLGVANPKITSPDDLVVAEALLDAGIGGHSRARRRDAQLCSGIGIDAHRFTGERALVLGGVTIPGAEGLAGHSDADALTHAIIDALLGAAGLGDIGALFGTDDPEWANADSVAMLAVVMDRLAEVGAAPQSIDATVIAERPKLRPYVDSMRQRLAGALKLDSSAVNVAATTAEGMGALGRVEGLAAFAVATVRVARDSHSDR